MEWIKCSDRMPEEMDDILSTDGIMVRPMWWTGSYWDCWLPNQAIGTDDVTHWMPLPNPPED